MNYKLQRIETEDRVFGKTIYHFARVSSTNKIAFSLAERGDAEGTVVLADEQFEGEGRTGREWFSPCGGLWFSFILHPKLSPEHTFIYPLVGTTAVVKTIKKLTSVPTYISWPNDVLIRGKKVSGVMCKLRIERGQLKFAIVGVGVNLNIQNFPTHLQHISTSLLLETQRLIVSSDFLYLFLKEFEDLYFLSNINQPLLMRKIMEFFPAPGTSMKFTSAIEEKIVYFKGIDQQGCLVVELENGINHTIKPQEVVSINYL